MLEALPFAGDAGPPRKLGSLPAYFVATAVTVFAILSQYFLPQSVPALLPVYSSFFGDLFVVYGIPILAFAVLVGGRPLAGFVANTGRAVSQGLAWYGVLSLLSLLVLFGLTIVYVILDPGALQLLSRTTPVISAAQSDPWFWVVFSFVVGLVEEIIFRGWIFGYWLARDPNRWVVHATWTSALFTGVHLYYGQTYGAATPLVVPELFFLGFAFAAAMRASGGNVLVVGLLHGLNDAVAFGTIINSDAAVALHYLIILVGAVVGLILYLRAKPAAPPPQVWYGPTGPLSPYPPGDPYAWLPPPNAAPIPPPPPPPPPTPNPPSGPPG